MKYILLLALPALLYQKVHSQAKLDPSFGNEGYVSILENAQNSYAEKATQVLQQADGKLLVFLEGGKIARHNANSSLDLSWGIQGFQSVESGPGVFLPDGKIIIAGVNQLQRLQANGKPDSSFGTNSKIAYSTTFYSSTYDVAVQADGKIVVAGGYSNPNQNSRQLSLVRYNPNGTPDANFGNGGQVITPTNYQYAEGWYIAIKSDGKIVVAGDAFNGSSNDVYSLLVQYNANGSLDNAFGGSGMVQTLFTGTNWGQAALAVQADGKIWLGASTSLTRYTANGSADLSLYTGYTDLRSIIIQPDGKIVTGGYVFLSRNRYSGESDYDFCIVRFLPNGTRDNTFNGGAILIGFQLYDYMTSMLIQPDGKLVAVGYTKESLFNPYTDYVMTRVNTTGTLDNSFNGSGKLQAYIPAFRSGFSLVAVQPDSKILTAGSGYMYRFNPDGSRDSSFAKGGKQYVGFSSSYPSYMAVQPNGRILYSYGYALLRYLPHGSADSSFSGDGVLDRLPVGSDNNITAFSAQTDGTILVAELFYINNIATPSLLRYKSDGSLDSSFNGNRIAAPFFTGGKINTIVVQPDGKIIAAGSVSNGSQTSFAVARYNPDGSPDTGFGAGGKASTSFDSAYTAATTVLLLPNGKLAVGGKVSNYFAIAYFNADGSSDNNAGNAGKFVFGSRALALDMYPITEGEKFLIAGTFYNRNSADVFMARLNPDGSLDSSWGTAGTIVADFGREDFHPAIAVSGKRLYLAETNSLYSYENVDNSGILAAFLPEAATPPTPPPPSKNGLTYRFYQGTWTGLPDFSKLTPVQTGTTPSVDINVRPAGVNTNYAFVWEGYISIPAPGDYTFETFSDDGSRFYFNSFYAPTTTALIDHDGVHYAYGKKATIHVDSSGLYPVAITYFQKELDAVMKLYWTGPGIPKQLIPKEAFNGSFQPLPANGLNYRFYQGSWNFLPDFASLTPLKTGTTPNVDINVRPAGVNTNYAFLWEGYINIKTPGDYTFETFSDDGSKFYFNSAYAYDAPAVIYNDGVHYAVANRGTVHVDTPGRYPVAIIYFQKEGDAVMDFYWTGPGIQHQRVPDAAFTDGYTGSIAADSGKVRQRAGEEITTRATIKLYPNPFTDRVQVETNNTPEHAVMTVELFDAAGKKVYTRFQNLASGRSTLTVDLQGSKYPAGVYQLQVRLNGLPVKTTKMVKTTTSPAR